MRCFAVLSIDMFVFFTRYSLRYLSLKLNISSIKLLLFCVIVQSMWHSLSLRNYLLVLTARGPSKVDKGHRSLSEDI